MEPITMEESKNDTNLLISPSGDFAYANVILPAFSEIGTAYENKRGVVSFDEDVIIPILYGNVEKSVSLLSGKVISKRRIWMSQTPMECFTLRHSINSAKGKILIAGFGLGWLVNEISKKDNVTHIDVVEFSQELMDWYYTQLKQNLNSRINNIIIEDFYKFMEYVKTSDYDSILVDIWPNYSDSRNDSRLLKLMVDGYPIEAWGIY